SATCRPRYPPARPCSHTLEGASRRVCACSRPPRERSSASFPAPASPRAPRHARGASAPSDDGRGLSPRREPVRTARFRRQEPGFAYTCAPPAPKRRSRAGPELTVNTQATAWRASKRRLDTGPLELPPHGITNGIYDCNRALSRAHPQQRISDSAMVARLREQQIERKAREIIGNRLDALVLLLIEDLSIRAAAVAALGADRGWPPFDRPVRDALRRVAVTARHA